MVEEEEWKQGETASEEVGGGQPNLAAIVQAAVSASLTAAMEGVEDIMKASVEARTTEADPVRGILSVTRVHIRHI